VQIVNLTPHPLIIERTTNASDPGAMSERIEILSSGIARCEATDKVVGHINGIDVVETTFGEVVGLPAPDVKSWATQEGTVYVVSSITAQACRDRGDVFVPARPIRDAQGRIIACAALGRIS
jgi:hypothetical protein